MLLTGMKIRVDIKVGVEGLQIKELVSALFERRDALVRASGSIAVARRVSSPFRCMGGGSGHQTP